MKKQRTIETQSKLNNEGFSLVELIVVIAIMAILIGVMAPNMISYIERTNVSADIQFADTVRTAVKTAMMDPQVLNDDDSAAHIQKLESTSTGMDLTALLSEKEAASSEYTIFGKTIAEILGANGPADINAAWVEKHIRSKNDGTAITINVKYDASINDIVVTLVHSKASIVVPN